MSAAHDVLGPLPIEAAVPFGPPPVEIEVDQLVALLMALGFPEGAVRLATEVKLTPTAVELWHVDPATTNRRIGWQIRVTHGENDAARFVYPRIGAAELERLRASLDRDDAALLSPWEVVEIAADQLAARGDT